MEQLGESHMFVNVARFFFSRKQVSLAFYGQLVNTAAESP